MSNRTRKRRRTGVCLMEALLGGTVLIMVSLFTLNLLALVVVHNSQDRLTYNAARIAASADPRVAQDAAKQIIAKAPRGGLVKNIELTEFKYMDKERVEVTVKTTTKVLASVPFCPNSLEFKTIAVAPVVFSPIIKF